MAKPREVIAERGTTHGSYAINAVCVRGMKDLVQSYPNWPRLTAAEKEALDMICTKIGRIMAGDPHFHDHWLDIAGYAQLAADEVHNAP